jgi:hypothetical protein
MKNRLLILLKFLMPRLGHRKKLEADRRTRQHRKRWGWTRRRYPADSQRRS